MRGRVRFGCLVALVVLAPATAAAENLRLNTRSRSNDGFAGPVWTKHRLTPGAYYLVRVAGTFSAWPLKDWQNSHPACGKPIPGPAFRPRHSKARPVGLDADTVFGAPADSHFCRILGPARPVQVKPGKHRRRRRPLSAHQTHFQISQGDGFAYTTPVGGPYSHPTRRHIYSYVLKLTANATRFGFRFVDIPSSDNYGVLRIRVRIATAQDCSRGRWRRFRAFANAQDCVAYMNAVNPA